MIYIINRNISEAKIVIYDIDKFDAYEYLPRIAPRQKISALSEAELCLKTAASSKRDPVFYWYDSKINSRVIMLL